MRISVLSLLAFLFSCGSEKTNGRLFIDHAFYSNIELADSLFEKGDSVRAFVKLRGSSKVFEVFDLSKWPDSIAVIYNMCYDDSKVILYKEIPQHEFDEYTIYYSYYFHDDHVFAIDIESRYFNENCSESAIVENKLYALKGEQLVIKKSSLKDVNGVSMDTTTCSFGRSPQVRKYHSLTETPIADYVKK